MSTAAPPSPLSQAVGAVREWPVPHAAAAVLTADGGVAATAGATDRRFALASVTKLLTAYAVLVAVEEGAVEWDTPAGPAGSTVAHLAAHTSGLAFSEAEIQAAPGTRRIYSNVGFDVLATTVADATGMTFDRYLAEAVLTPLGMTDAALDGPAGSGAVASCADLTRFAAELLAPTLVHPDTVAAATAVAFPGLDGVLPGYGRQRPNDWGLGFEIRGGKHPHWTGSTSSPRTFGHFGQSGTFLWVDPDAGAACVALTDRDFGPWAVATWSGFTDDVLTALRT